MAQNYSSMLHVDNNAQGKYMYIREGKVSPNLFLTFLLLLSCERENSAKNIPYFSVLDFIFIKLEEWEFQNFFQ